MARILVVEDDAHIIRVMCMWLTKSGHDVTEAKNGAVAQEFLAEGDFDLIVSDVNMPRVTGLELVRWLRQERSCNTPMILLSSRADQAGVRSQLEEFGVDLHPKPFSPSRLIRDIERQLGAGAAGNTG